MARMGHASTRAAMIYQHTARERDEHIADALDMLDSREQVAHGGPEIAVDQSRRC